MKLGQTGKDVVTGFTGIIMAKAQYLTGCNQVMLTPAGLDSEGRRREAEWFDESRVKVTGTARIKLAVVAENPGADECSAPRQ